MIDSHLVTLNKELSHHAISKRQMLIIVQAIDLWAKRQPKHRQKHTQLGVNKHLWTQMKLKTLYPFENISLIILGKRKSSNELTSMCKRPPTWPPVIGCKQFKCWDIAGNWWPCEMSDKCVAGPHWWLWEYGAACWLWCIVWWFWWTGWNWGWCGIDCIWCLHGVCCWFCGWKEENSHTIVNAIKVESSKFTATLTNQS